MKALITLVGASIGGQFVSDSDKPKSLLNVEYENEKQLIGKLKELQAGYSIEPKDKPKISRLNVPSKVNPGNTRKVLDCYTYADWHHVAHINVSSPSVPTEKLN